MLQAVYSAQACPGTHAYTWAFAQALQ